MHRRTFLSIVGTSAAAAYVGACAKRDARPAVTLYSSVDPAILDPVIADIGPGLRWRIQTITDSEATKTTGLVARLMAEKAAPKADLWWSGEIVGTIQLARQGVLAPLVSSIVAGRYAAAPAGLRDARNRWFALADRPRVVVYNTTLIPNAARPRSLADTISSARPGSANTKPATIAIANPAFGTTRGHMAALLARLGREAFTTLLSDANFRVVDGNSAVVRAVAMGEAAFGLTDFDDVVAGQANKWPIDCFAPPFDPAERSGPVLMTPGTIAMLAGAPNASGAQDLAEVLLSQRVEDALAKSVWRSRPTIGPSTNTDPRLAPLAAAAIDWERAVDVLPEAVELASRLLKV